MYAIQQQLSDGGMEYDNMELQVWSEVLPESYCITKHLLYQGPVGRKIHKWT